MRSRSIIAILATTLLCSAAWGAESKKPEIVPTQPTAATVKLILEAPGALSCYKNAGNLPESCAQREAGLKVFIHLYQENPKAALPLLKKRLAMDPDPNGVFFAILAASRIGEPKLVGDLQAFVARKPGSRMGAFASQAISIIETHECTKDVSPELMEICPPP